MVTESIELEAKVKELEDKVTELEKTVKMLMSAHSILIEQYALVEDHLHKLSRTIELNSVSLVSPLHIIELQNRESKGYTKRSKIEDLVQRAVNGIFSDYRDQFRE